jgi:hypothetical protein
VEGKLPRPPGLSGRHPCSTARHHHHPCSISDVKHMLRRLHRTRAHMSHPSSITSTIHEDGHRIAAEATARARSLPPLADLATRPPCAAGTPCGGRREGREEGGAAEATQPPRLPLTRLCPPHRCRRQARPPRHHRCRGWGGVGRGWQPRPSGLSGRPHMLHHPPPPPPTNAAESSRLRGQNRSPCTALRSDLAAYATRRGEGGSRRGRRASQALHQLPRCLRR